MTKEMIIKLEKFIAEESKKYARSFCDVSDEFRERSQYDFMCGANIVVKRQYKAIEREGAMKIIDHMIKEGQEKYTANLISRAIGYREKLDEILEGK